MQEQQERKKNEALEKKAETKALLEQEMANIKKATKAAPAPKITRAQINQKVTNTQKSEKSVVETHLTTPLEENINRVQVDGQEARSIGEAINILR